MTNKTSFGEYFDDQFEDQKKQMDHRGGGAWQAIEWLEAFEKRQAKKQQLALLKKITPVGPKEKKLLNEMIEEVWSDERLDALHKVNMADTYA